VLGAAVLATLAVGVVAWRARTHRHEMRQPVSQTTTVPSPSKTELPAPATPAVADHGTPVVHVDAGNARIELDRAPGAQAAPGARLHVGAGDHAVSVSAPGRRRYSGRVAVLRGATVELAVHLRHDAEPGVPAVTTAAAPRPAAAPKKRDSKDPDYLVDPFTGPK